MGVSELMLSDCFSSQARQKEKSKGSNLLQDIHGDGRPLILTEDEKLWGMVESKYWIIEFDVAKIANADTLLQKKAKAVKVLQRHWRKSISIRNATGNWKKAFSTVKAHVAFQKFDHETHGMEKSPSLRYMKKKSVLWKSLQDASLPDAIEALILDMENIEAVAKIHHAMKGGKKGHSTPSKQASINSASLPQPAY